MNNIDPALEKIMRPLIKKMQETITEGESDEQTLWNLLWLFAVSKWVTLEEDKDGLPVWRATDQLPKRVKLPLNVIPFPGSGAVDADEAPRVATSLQIIIDASIVCSDSNLTLLAFVGKGLAQLVSDAQRRLVYVPTTELLRNVANDPAQWGGLSGGGDAPAWRVDELLREIIGLFVQDAKELGAADGDEIEATNVAGAVILPLMELHGEAVAYRDADGRLAWRATEKLYRGDDGPNKRQSRIRPHPTEIKQTLDLVLANIMTPLVKEMQKTNTKGESDEQALLSLLLFFAAKKWATLGEDKDGLPVWRATDRVPQDVKLPLNVIPFPGSGVGDTEAAPRTATSLQIIIDASMVCPNQDLTLLAFAGKGLAELVSDARGNLIWRSTVKLLLDLVCDPAQWGDVIGGDDAPTYRMDEVLRDIVDVWVQEAKRIGLFELAALNAAAAVILPDMEINDEAIAYRDADGRLAWKASDELYRDVDGRNQWKNRVRRTVQKLKRRRSKR
jgi:hypothetical protein